MKKLNKITDTLMFEGEYRQQLVAKISKEKKIDKDILKHCRTDVLKQLDNIDSKYFTAKVQRGNEPSQFWNEDNLYSIQNICKAYNLRAAEYKRNAKSEKSQVGIIAKGVAGAVLCTMSLACLGLAAFGHLSVPTSLGLCLAALGSGMVGVPQVVKSAQEYKEEKTSRKSFIRDADNLLNINLDYIAAYFSLYINKMDAKLNQEKEFEKSSGTKNNCVEKSLSCSSSKELGNIDNLATEQMSQSEAATDTSQHKTSPKQDKNDDDSDDFGSSCN
jgi:hypothetical protein